MSQPAQQQDVPGVQGRMEPVPDCGEQSYEGHGKLTGKVALITGADSGIGRAVAIAYAREGADVVISYLSEHEDAEGTADWVRKAGRTAITIPGDVSDPDHCREIVRRTVEELGRVDILVNNAAYQMNHSDLEEVSDEEWQHTFATNVSAKVDTHMAMPINKSINIFEFQTQATSAHVSISSSASRGRALKAARSSSTSQTFRVPIK